jgi:flavin reductase (DIM6/NTAB) family NADH-FMN oxidoreductase RutF
MVSSNSSIMPTSPPSAIEFRQALGQFATGVTVVTAERAPGQVHGMTASSFASVSLDPPLILVCVDHRAHMLAILQKQKRFGISILKEHQQKISKFFAQPEQDPAEEKELGIGFRWTPSGIPLLENTLVQLGCHVAAAHVSGDHTVFIGEVESAELHSGAPLLYCRGGYQRLAPLL